MQTGETRPGGRYNAALTRPEAPMKKLNAQSPEFPRELAALLAFESAQNPETERIVADICADVRQRGDAALIEYSNRFDGMKAHSMQDLTLTPDDLRAAFERLPAATRDALQTAAARVEDYHRRQKQESWHYRDADGTLLGQKITPLDRVGIYVPGGKAAYPSSVIMNAMPAHVAGVPEIIMVVPTPHGERNDIVLAAAHIAGVNKIFTIGGAQAIAALAYGTESVPAVDKITGPGNAFVAAAKRRVFGVVGIDMVAGPSEILIIADGSTPADWVAMDLFSQAEHDEIAQAILISTSADYLDAVEAAMQRLINSMPRRAIIEASLKNRGALIQAKDPDDACAIANQIAPEHLELSVAEPAAWLDKIRHAGAIFLGAYSSESLGDYCAGPNHVLPTSRSARFSSPLGTYDFQKRSSLIEVSAAGAEKLGNIAGILARGESLTAHACAAEMRLPALSPTLSQEQPMLTPAQQHAVTICLNALTTGGMNAFASLMADDIRWHQPGHNPFSGTHQGKENVLRMIGGLIKHTGDTLQLSPNGAAMANGDLIACPFRLTGTSGDKNIDQPGMLLLEMRDGKFGQVWLFAEDDAAGDDFLG